VPAAAKAVAPATIPAPATTTPTPAPPSAAHSVPRTLPAVPSAALAAEVDLLNRAQAAAQRRDHRETLARIAEHDRRFPAGALAQEAEVLRIAALFGVGQRAIAAARATRFLERNGDGVLAARVRSMLSAEAADEGRRNP
jgi:hypothetical protein